VKVLGIDPGSSVTGYGVVEGIAARPGSARLLECGVVRAGEGPLPARLLAIHRDLGALVARHRPDAISVEGIFFGRNARSTVVLGHARGVVLLAAAEAGLDVFEYAPRLVKQAVVGRGEATKAQVGWMVAKLLRLERAPSPADASDGVALALAHLLLAARPQVMRQVKRASRR
jgi:crossover junction endodeoxyribonuclease RuvC